MLTRTVVQARNVNLVLPSMHTTQKEFYCRPERFLVACCGSKWGKDLSLKTPLSTPYKGFQRIEDLEVGDYVYGTDRLPTRITGMTEVFTTNECYHVMFENESFTCGAGHLWKHCIDDVEFVSTTKDLYDLQKNFPINVMGYGVHEIRRTKTVPTRCITVDARDHMFLVGECYIPTHNSYGAAIKMVQEAWNHEGWILWWIAPVYQQCKIGLNEILKLLPQSRYNYYKSDMIVELIKANGQPYSRIEFKSAQDPDKLRGFKVNLALMDEADRISEESFLSAYTTLAPVKGRAIIVSTPKTRSGPFYREWMKGIKDSPQYDPNYYSGTYSTHCNPHIDREVLDQAQKNLPEDVFRTEYLAEWPSGDGGSVFRNFSGCVLREQGFVDEQPGHAYVMGVDLAKHSDFTVLTVIDKITRTVVYWERFNELDWKIQKSKIVQIATKYNKAMTIMDTTGGSVGDVIIDDLRDTSTFPIVGYKISTNTLKKALIEKLQMALTNKTVYLPAITQMLTELQMFEYQISDHGTVQYAAPIGFHDDCVISLALAVYGLEQEPYVYKFKSIRGI